MDYLVTRDEMQAIDAYSINQIGIPGLVLMEKAALSMEKIFKERFSKEKSVLIVTELGNNGGDGLALARLLLADGYRVDIYEIGGILKASDSYRVQKNILENLKIPVLHAMPDQDYDIYVDAIFGVGLKREVKGIQAEVIEVMNRREGFKIAVDVPSGVDATNGKILGTAFRADLTITFGLSKIGLILYPGADYCGEIAAMDIGFPKQAVEAIDPKCFCYKDEDLSLLPKRKADSHKGTYGRVLLIAGSKNMAGAAYLAAKAAYRMGCGLVRIFTCEENRVILQSRIPEAILTTYESSLEAENLLKEALLWANVIGIGPGLGKSDLAHGLLEQVLRQGKAPLLIDADGLNLLSEDEGLKGILGEYPNSVVLTPHLLEMSRLTGISVPEIKSDLIKAACEFSGGNKVVALKDTRTVVACGDEKVYINVSGNHGMAVGGSGDVLSGIILTALAGGLCAADAARLGVYVHGRAGDYAAKQRGYHGLLAEDIAECLHYVIH